MTRARCVAAVLLVAAGPASPAGAWGPVGHRIVVDAAVRALDGPLGAFARERAPFLAERSLDPDLSWRDACGHEEAVRHFFDLDLYGGDAASVPRDPGELRARFGAGAIARNGVLPWAIEELAECLVDAFREGDFDRAAQHMGELAHYTADLAQPMHLSSNYDGQSTGQRGVHHRYESDLVESRARDLRRRLARRPPAPAEVGSPIEAAFAAMPGAEGRIERILAADLAAALEHGPRGAGYHREMWRRLGDALADDLARGAALTAGTWRWAWESAGRPPLPVPAAGGAEEGR